MPSARRPRLSPSSLNAFLGCEHRTYLDILVERGELHVKQAPRPDAELILERGRRHEEAFLAGLRAEGRDVLSLPPAGGRPADLAATTEAAMRAGRDVIHQACLLDGGWIGYADFLVRIDEPSDLGPWSYEVHDAKLSRHAKPDYIFQLLFYTAQVERIQGRRPRRMHLVLGDGDQPPFAPEDFEAYAAQVVERFDRRRRELAAPVAEPAYPYPVADCDYCPFWKHCDDKRRAEDHLSLVATLQRRHGVRLEEVGVRSVAAVAALRDDVRVPRIGGDTLAALRQQARLQVASRATPRPVHELLPPEPGRGFARLPKPSPGDVYFDFEGDPFWGDDGLEYLFGTGWYDEDGAWRYWPLWAEDPAGERANFERWMAWITERLEAHRDLHVYHYNHYEPTALKALMSRYGVCEDQVDDLLRRTVLVDLYAVVRQSMRVGVERYGLKWLEPVFGFDREGEIEGASGSLRHWQAYLDTGERDELRAIEIYNDNDCRSTAALLKWLRDQRAVAEAQYGVTIDELEAKPPRELTDKQREWADRVDAARAALDAVPGAEVLRELIDYHRREAKPGWWQYFARTEMTPDELRDEDAEAIGGLVEATDIERETVKRSWLIPLRFPEQRYKLVAGDAMDPVTEKPVTVQQVDEANRIVWIRRGKSSNAALPQALAPSGPYSTIDQQQALVALAERIAATGFARDAVSDLLLHRRPRLRPGAPALADGAVDLDVLREQVAALDDSVLFVQGPPGSGKTYTGARLAVDLMRRGRRVGVMATSHKAIGNLLAEIDACADEEGFDFRGLKKCGDDEDSRYESDRIEPVDDRSCFPREASTDAQLLAGTAWLWSWESMRGAVDVLFVDEAGQVSLADALAVSQGAASVVLLGDPQQLAHVSQGTHPDGSGESVLRHLLGERNTVEAERGVLLRTSWRMHPDVCGFVSETMYDGRLEPRPECAGQRIDSPGLAGTGLRYIPVEHADRETRAPEEAAAVAAEVGRLLDGGTFVDRDGVRRELTLDDILVVAPFNAQVRCLRAALPEGARVGTVDKFQGQEAPVVFFSMASSSGADVPRGMDFLFSRNRLNVAVSRAQAMAVVVCSPLLLWTPTSTIEQMRLVNMLCRFVVAADAGLTGRRWPDARPT